MPPAEQDATAAPADVVVALVGTGSGTALRRAVAAVRSGVPADLRVVVMYPQEAEPVLWPDDATLSLVAQPMSHMDRIPAVTPAAADTYRTVFTLAHRLRARAAVVLGSDPGALSSSLVQALVHPILDQGLDVVTALYARSRFEGLINSAVVYPLTRALYGKRIRGQLGLDFAFSARLAASGRNVAGAGGPAGRPVWIIPQALADDLTVGQTNLGLRLPSPRDSSDLEFDADQSARLSVRRPRAACTVLAKGPLVGAGADLWRDLRSGE